MQRRLPSLMALQAFEAAARLHSFAEAGRACCLTPGAISRQLRLLEAELGTSLLRRESGRLALTADGTAYLKEIAPALARIERATARVARQGEVASLHVTTLPGFGACWLMPRHARFVAGHPKIRLNLYTRTEDVDFARHPFDAAIYFNSAPPPALVADPLLVEEQVAVCHPRLRPAGPRPSIQALARLPLILHLDRPAAWEDWLADLGCATPELRHGPGFQHAPLMAEAASAGLGLALLPRFLVAEDLAAGRLVAPFAHLGSSRRTYWLTYPAAHGQSRPLQAFRAWLLAEMRSGPSGFRSP
ncbi:LysR substrate-binding domain-containing protein [Roseomonas sp. 18066]|uniref:LysR substrate-binding domain-containing protein n=1 Tax=Roseomonas sp. 18066 TaxID=2681412 RepID=UPI00135BEFC1|nr:LysR substrate-binding domain-containing protein [Roseomonas sp. 18066]